jgi:hypothetical protein
MQSGLAASFVTPSPKKTDGKADRAVDDEPYINERKLSTMTAAKGDSNNGVFENGRFFTSDVTQRTQKNRFFLNDVTKDTDAHKKYSLQTSLVGKPLPKLTHEIP